MRSIKIKNKSIAKIYEFLETIALKNKASRGKTKFQRRLQEKYAEYNEFLNEIRQKYFKVDDNGQFLVVDNHLQFLDDITEKQKLEYVKELNELDNDMVEISFSEYSEQYEAMFKALEELDVELKGDQAFAYDELMDAYDESNKVKGGI